SDHIMIFFFFQAEDGIRDRNVTGVQTCALPISGQYRRCFYGPTSPPLHGQYRRIYLSLHAKQYIPRTTTRFQGPTVLGFYCVPRQRQGLDRNQRMPHGPRCSANRRTRRTPWCPSEAYLRRVETPARRIGLPGGHCAM